MALQNQQGQLVQTDDASTQQLAQLQGSPVTPTTPVGVAGIGASPDQAKMAGTPNQKQNALTADQQRPQVVQQQSTGQDTLQQAQRTEAARSSTTDTEEQAQQKATQLQSLGSLQTRVQALISKDLALSNPAQAQASSTQIQALPVAQQQQAQALIQKVAANPNDPNAVAEATQFWVDQGWGTLDSFSPDKFMATAQETLGSQAGAQVQATTGGQVTLKDVQLQPDEAANLTAVFGDDSWQGLTVPQLSQKIEDMRQASYNTAGGLRAQLATATGAQRQEILSQLGDLGQVGQTGAEQSVKDVKQAVDQGDTVTIGGEQHKVEDLLKDGGISDLVTRMLGDPQLAAKVAQTNPEFAAWVKNNTDSLSALSKQAATTMGSVRDVNSQTAALAKVGNTSLNDQVMSQIIPNWGKIQATVPDASKSGIMGALKDPNLDQTSQQGLANALNRVAQADPAQLKALGGLDAPGVKMAYDDAQAVKKDATGLFAELTGAGQNPDFITDPGAQKTLNQYQGVVSALGAVSDKIQSALQDPQAHAALVSMIKDGSFTPADAQLLAKNPTGIKDYLATHQKLQTLQTAASKGDIDTVLSTVFGSGTDAKAMDQEYQLAKQMYTIDPSSDGGKKYLQFKQLLDPSGTGHIDPNAILAQEQKTLGGSFEDILGGGAPQDSLAAKAKASGLNAATLDLGKEGSFFNKMSGFLSDGKLTTDEVSQLDAMHKQGLVSDAQWNQLFSGAYKSQLGKLDQAGYGKYVQTQKDTADTKAATDLSEQAFQKLVGPQAWDGATMDSYLKSMTDTYNGDINQYIVKPLDDDHLNSLSNLASTLQGQLKSTTGAGTQHMKAQLDAVNNLIQIARTKNASWSPPKMNIGPINFGGSQFGGPAFNMGGGSGVGGM